MPTQGPGALIWDVERLRVATDAAGAALWSWNVDTDEIDLDERACNLWGVPPGLPVTFGDLSTHIHPTDVDRVQRDFAATRRQTGGYEIDFRVLFGGAVRWISARGRGGDEGHVERVMFGLFMDVTERRRIEEGREILAIEMGHRVKNLFSIATRADLHGGAIRRDHRRHGSRPDAATFRPQPRARLRQPGPATVKLPWT